MKNLFIAAVITGVAVVGVILYITRPAATNGGLINFNDGSPLGY